jgi:hypothetical protein
MIDINTTSKSNLIKLRGVGRNLADAIIRARPFKCRNDILRVSGINEGLLKKLEEQGLRIGKRPTTATKFYPKMHKYPAWTPRPVIRLIKEERPKLMVNEPRSGVLAIFDLADERIPLVHLSTENDSALFEIENNEPRFEIKTSSGKLYMDTTGVIIEGKRSKKKFSWNEKKKISKTIAQLALNDEVFKSIGVTLGKGLRIAAPSTRGAESSIGTTTFTGGVTDSVSDISLVGGIIPGQIGETFPICTATDFGESIIEDAISLGQKIVDCTVEVIETIVEECIDPVPDCLQKAADDLNSCKKRCNRKYKKWYNKWMRPICKGGCYVQYGIDAAICLGKALICTIITTTETVVHCITESGYVSPEEDAHECDIRLYEAEGAIGNAIDYATCGYGYSHAALVCEGQMVHATEDGVVTTPLDYYGNKKYATVRLGLSGAQCKQLCRCVQNKIGADYDYLEAITFGTVDDPGKEICTMLIMNCLDEIGFDRGAVGLSGFVSPNDLARALGAPRASNL